MKLTALVALMTLVVSSQATITTLRGSDTDGTERGSETDHRNLQGGDLTVFIVDTVNDILAGQVGTINTNVADAITDPLEVGTGGNVDDVATIDPSAAVCGGVSADLAYVLGDLTGTANTMVDSMTLYNFQNLAFSLCGDITLDDSVVRMRATGTPFTMVGDSTLTATDGADCDITERYPFTATITDTAFEAFATLAGAGTASSGFALTKLDLTSFALTPGTTTIDIEDLDSGILADQAEDIETAVIDEINAYITDDLAAILEEEFREAIDAVVTLWLSYENSAQVAFTPEIQAAWPSRGQIARSWFKGVFGF